MVRFTIVLCISAAAFLARQMPADACGLKIASSAPRTKKLTPLSQSPSRILLLGDLSRSTATTLVEAGHSVEVADDPASARGKSYHVVVAGSDMDVAAKESWPGVIIVSGQGNSDDVLARVEAQLDEKPSRTLIARRPVRTSEERRPIATSARTDGRQRVASGSDSARTRTPIATGGGTTSTGVVASGGGEPDETEETPEPAASEPVAVAEVETPAEQPKVRSAARPRRVKGFTTHIYFRNASADLGDRFKAKLVRNARWLKRHRGRNVTIEGHANTVGVPAANKALSQARSESVRDFLVEQGVDESRIQTEAFGMERPEFKPGSNPKNRRVIILIER